MTMLICAKLQGSPDSQIAGPAARGQLKMVSVASASLDAVLRYKKIVENVMHTHGGRHLRRLLGGTLCDDNFTRRRW